MSHPQQEAREGGFPQCVTMLCQCALDTARLSPTLGVNEGNSKSYTSPHLCVCFRDSLLITPVSGEERSYKKSPSLEEGELLSCQLQLCRSELSKVFQVRASRREDSKRAVRAGRLFALSLTLYSSVEISRVTVLADLAWSLLIKFTSLFPFSDKKPRACFCIECIFFLGCCVFIAAQ